MTWQIDLIGEGMDVTDVQKLAQFFGCAIVTGAEGKPCLVGERFDALSEVDEVRAKAREALVILNGLALSRYTDHRPVQIGDAVSWVHPDGHLDANIGVSSIDGRGRLSADTIMIYADGSRASTIDENAERCQRILANPKLLGGMEALTGDLTRQRLRIAIEKVNALIGKSGQDYNALVASKYATTDEVRQLKANIEDPRVGGLDALHAFPSSPQPGGPKMSLQDCRAFILRIFFVLVDRT